MLISARIFNFISCSEPGSCPTRWMNCTVKLLGLALALALALASAAAAWLDYYYLRERIHTGIFEFAQAKRNDPGFLIIHLPFTSFLNNARCFGQT
jgi:hypothetical protein